jgi:hypothetical protein
MKWWPIERLLPDGTPLPFVPPKLIKKALAQIPVGIDVSVPLDTSGPWNAELWPVLKDWWSEAAQTATLRLSIRFRQAGIESPTMVVSMTRVKALAGELRVVRDRKPGRLSAENPEMKKSVRALEQLRVNGFLSVPLGSLSAEKAQNLWRAAAKIVGVSIRTKKVLLGKNAMPHLHIQRVEKPQ